MKKTLLVLLGLAVVVVGVAAYFAGSVAKESLRRALTYALGVETTIASMGLSPLSGEFRLEGLLVENPEGYSADHFLTLGSGRVNAELSSLTEEVVHVRAIEFSDLSLSIERNGDGANYDVLLSNLERFESEGSGAGAPAEERGTAKRFLVDRLVCRNVGARLEVSGLGSDHLGMDVTVPEVVLTNVGTAEGGATVGQIASRLIRQLLRSSIEAGGSRTPAELYADVRARVDRGLGDVRSDAEGAVRDALEDATKKVGEVLGDEAAGALGERAQDAVDQGMEELGNALGGILGGDDG